MAPCHAAYYIKAMLLVPSQSVLCLASISECFPLVDGFNVVEQAPLQCPGYRVFPNKQRMVLVVVDQHPSKLASPVVSMLSNPFIPTLPQESFWEWGLRMVTIALSAGVLTWLVVSLYLPQPYAMNTYPIPQNLFQVFPQEKNQKVFTYLTQNLRDGVDVHLTATLVVEEEADIKKEAEVENKQAEMRAVDEYVGMGMSGGVWHSRRGWEGTRRGWY